MKTEKIRLKFKELFSSEPIIIRSPGRINLIGEHTDYNGGFVFPAAIDKEVYFAVAKNNCKKFRFYAYDLDESFETTIGNISISSVAWANYLLGVAAQFIKEGFPLTSGVDCVFGGDIPMGAGLSSSAAIENGFAFALNKVFDFSIDKLQMVKMAQKAEHEYAGVMCGIMDQFASMFGKQNQAIKLDCRSLDYEYANINMQEYAIVLCDTNVKHELAASEYNLRRSECESGVKILQKYYHGINALRDVSFEMLEEHKKEFNPIIYNRCVYVVKENKRVEDAFLALHENNIEKFGDLMYQSHEGLCNEYEVSCYELDILVEISKRIDGVVGARMMGGGFGGCTINLVKRNNIDEFISQIKKEYSLKTQKQANIYITNIVEGTGAL